MTAHNNAAAATVPQKAVFLESFPSNLKASAFPLIFKSSVWETPPKSLIAPAHPTIVQAGSGPTGLLNSVRSVGWPLFDLREEIVSIESKESDDWGNESE